MNRKPTLVASVVVCVRTFAIVIVALGMLGWVGRADAQPVYFHDDFDGSTLKPHWLQPPPEHWSYTVDNGQLNVTELKYPSQPKTGWNYAQLFASLALPASGDFHAEVAMTMELQSFPANVNRLVAFYLQSTPAGVSDPLGIKMEYVEFGNEAAWAMSSSGQFAGSSNFANPGPFVISLSRIADAVHFGMDGTLLATLPATPGFTIQSLRFDFLAQWPDAQIEPIRIDRVTIVPSPGHGACIAAGLWALSRRRR